MKKKFFFCIGTQKGGTTTLHDILAQNNQIALPKQKETHFFSVEELYQKGLDYYFKMYFKGEGLLNSRIVGEIDPSYSFFGAVPKRIFQELRKDYDIKFIFILRDPVARAYSQYLMSKRRGYEKLDFIHAVYSEEKRIKDQFGFVNHSYINRGYYSKQIQEYFEFFPKEDFLFLRFEEDFLKCKRETIERINSFLGLGGYDYSLNVKSNPASVARSPMVRDLVHQDGRFRKLVGKVVRSRKIKDNAKIWINKINFKETVPPRLDEDIRKRVYTEFFQDETRLLEKITGLDLSNWKQGAERKKI